MVPPCVGFAAFPRWGTTPVARQSRFHGVLGWGFAAPMYWESMT